MKHAAHATGTVPVVAVALAASALTAGAVFSVAHAGCSSPGDYVRQGNQIVLVGGCVTPDELPADSVQVHRAHQPAGFDLAPRQP